MIKKISLLICCTFILNGCSSLSKKQAPAPVYKKIDSAQRSTSQKKKNVETIATTRVKVVQDPIILKQQKAFAKTQFQSSNVVVALLSEADMSYKQGNLDESGVTIERALRIQPRNPLLLYKLAVLRLQQGQADLAENLAKKSALLASGDAQLKKKNWLLIAEAREQLGNQEGVQAARKKAQQF